MSASPTGAKTGNAGQAAPGIDDAGLTARVAELLDRWPSAGLAAGVIRGACMEWFFGHAVANVESKERVTHGLPDRVHHQDLHRHRREAAVGTGLVDLDVPANDYLRSIRLIPAKARFRPATVRHLLTHTAGIG